MDELLLWVLLRKLGRTKFCATCYQRVRCLESRSTFQRLFDFKAFFLTLSCAKKLVGLFRLVHDITAASVVGCF